MTTLATAKLYTKDKDSVTAQDNTNMSAENAMMLLRSFNNNVPDKEPIMSIEDMMKMCYPQDQIIGNSLPLMRQVTCDHQLLGNPCADEKFAENNRINGVKQGDWGYIPLSDEIKFLQK